MTIDLHNPGPELLAQMFDDARLLWIAMFVSGPWVQMSRAGATQTHKFCSACSFVLAEHFGFTSRARVAVGGSPICGSWNLQCAYPTSNSPKKYCTIRYYIMSTCPCQVAGSLPENFRNMCEEEDV